MKTLESKVVVNDTTIVAVSSVHGMGSWNSSLDS